MALVLDDYWLKLAGRERSMERRESRGIKKGRKSEELGFETRKKLIARQREESALYKGGKE